MFLSHKQNVIVLFEGHHERSRMHSVGLAALRKDSDWEAVGCRVAAAGCRIVALPRIVPVAAEQVCYTSSGQARVKSSHPALAVGIQRSEVAAVVVDSPAEEN